jgi:hypothetical protein
MGLSSQIIYLCGLNMLNDPDQVRRIGKISVVKNEAMIPRMRILIKVVDAVRIEQRGATLNAVDLVTFFEKKFCKVRSILSCNTGDESNFVHIILLYNSSMFCVLCSKAEDLKVSVSTLNIINLR